MTHRLDVYVNTVFIRRARPRRESILSLITARLRHRDKGRETWVVDDVECAEWDVRFRLVERRRWWEDRSEPALLWCKCGRTAYLLREPFTYARADRCALCCFGPHALEVAMPAPWSPSVIRPTRAVGTAREDLAEIEAFANQLSEALGGVVFAKVGDRYPSIIHLVNAEGDGEQRS
jgi:hypothetical protein